MKIPVSINSHKYYALIDTGSDDSYINSSCVNDTKLIIKPGKERDIITFGNNLIKTKGVVEVEMKIASKDLIQKFNVLDASEMKYDIVLGINFLKEKEVTLEVNKRTLTIGRINSENIEISVNNIGDVVKEMRHKQKIYAKEKCTINGREDALVHVNISEINDNDDYYFEGKNYKEVSCISGVINANNKMILIKNHGRNKTTIKEGQEVGTISTLLDEEEENEDEGWTQEKLRKEIKLDNITDNEKNAVYEMLLSVNRALSAGDTDIGEAQVTPHRIELHNHTPIWQKHRHFAKPIEDQINNQCQELLSNDIIEYSNSNWSSPCVPVKKPDGSLRLCIDYRKINKVTKTERFPMPSINNCLYQANDVKFFTKIDLVKGYYQVKLDDESKPLTAFSTSTGHYQFKRLSFGLKNSGIAFQKMMQQILSPLKSNIIIYIDDILIMSRKFEDHIQMVRKVLYTLGKYGIKIKVNKCDFFKQEVSFLGHVLDTNGIRKSPEFVKKVRDFPQPSTVKELRKFLGLINFQRKFIEKCSEVSKPLNALMGKPDKMKIEWNEELEKSYEKLKIEIEKDVTLTYPNYNKNAAQLELFVDASNTGAGACLMQMKQDGYAVIGYNSMCFSQTQRNYSTTERELAAIRWGLEVFKPFIYGIKFTVYTDHKPLIYMYNMAASSSRIMRTLEEISQYDFDIKYLPGSQNQAADFLSRMENMESIDEENHIGIPKEFRISQKVEGGGNSMFESLLIAMRDAFDEEENKALPESHMQMRMEIINELLENMQKYKICNNKQEKNKLKLMMKANQMPNTEALLAASRLYRVEIRVYHDIKTPIVYNADLDSITDTVINLQCIGQCHFNPLFSRKSKSSKVSKRYINTIRIDEREEREFDEDNLHIGNLYETEEEVQLECEHDVRSVHFCANYNGYQLCAMVDTGSQISIIGEDTWNRVKAGNEHIIMKSNNLVSIDGKKTKSIAIVEIKLDVNGHEISETFPFCIVEQNDIPNCLLIGLNFLDFFHTNIRFKENLVSIGNKCTVKMRSNKINTFVKLTSVEIEDEGCKVQRVEFLISKDELCTLQSSNRSLHELKNNILNKISNKKWNDVALNQFKRYACNLQVRDDLLIYGKNGNDCTVINYPFMVEVLAKVHQKVGHIGRHKLLDLVSRQFWHPAMDKISRQLCRSCKYCQLNKPHCLSERPPTLKISTDKPFQLVSMDLVAFPKSKAGNVAALVVIDHGSKWMMAAPVKNKSSITIAKILKTQIFPCMIKIPKTILSDNGLEFKGKETEAVLSEFNIKHLYSSPYYPQGNGSVERVNRTLINIMKSVTKDMYNWDIYLPKTVVIYNNTIHSMIKSTPADYLMKVSHDPSREILVDKETTEQWREGHPNFKPFIIGQKVIKEIARIGNRTEYKLMPKYEGPFIIKKVQTNGVSYEIIREGEEQKLTKCNHRKLRPFHEIPEAIRRFLPKDENQSETEEQSSDDCAGPFTNFSTSDESDVSSDGGSSSNSDDSIRVKVKKVKFKMKNNEINNKCISNIDENIDNLYCTEIHNANNYNHSTPREQIDVNFEEYLKFNSFTDSLTVLENNISAQIELLSLSETKISELSVILDEMLNEAMIEDKAEEKSKNIGEALHENILNMNKGEDDVDQNSESASFKRDVSAAETVNQIKSILKSCRENISSGRLRRHSLQREILEYKQSKSMTTTTRRSVNEISTTANETEDIVRNLTPVASSTPRRVLRSSCTKVQEYPNVQSSTLEYKRKKL